MAAAGLLAEFASWYLKWVIITRAACNQGFALQHTPARGGGRPGPGTKPGWQRSPEYQKAPGG